MKGDVFGRAIDAITSIEHPSIHKVKNIYADDHAMYLVSESLDDHPSLVERGTF